MSKEAYITLTESTVGLNTAIARLYAMSANHKKIIYTMTHSLPKYWTRKLSIQLYLAHVAETRSQAAASIADRTASQ